MTAPRSPWTPGQPNTPNVVPAPAPAVKPEPQRADQDVLIDRPELGPGACTLVVAGDGIPAYLADRPRRPARPGPPDPPKPDPPKRGR